MNNSERFKCALKGTFCTELWTQLQIHIQSLLKGTKPPALCGTLCKCNVHINLYYIYFFYYSLKIKLTKTVPR